MCPSELKFLHLNFWTSVPNAEGIMKGCSAAEKLGKGYRQDLPMLFFAQFIKDTSSLSSLQDKHEMIESLWIQQ